MTYRLPVVFVGALLTAAPLKVLAGTVTLMADQSWCCVEVKSGNGSDLNSNPSVFDGPVSPGVIYVGADGMFVCYRRENR